MTYTPTPQEPIGSGFGKDTTAAEVLAGIDLTGRTALVTGGYSGIGLETTRALAAAGARVIVPARRPETAAEALAGIDGVTVEALDLGDLASVEAFAGAHAGQRRRARHGHRQRRHHGLPRDPGRSGLGGAARHQPPRALRARQPAVAGARARRARRQRLLDRAT